MRHNHNWALSSVAVALGCIAFGAVASAQVELNNNGRMSQSTIRDRVKDRNRDRDRNRWPAPVPGWTGGVQFIPGSGYYSGCEPVIFVNNSACYLPGYYAGLSYYGPNGYSGYNNYSSGGFSFGMQMGGISYGYQQNAGSFGGGYVSYGAPVPPAVPQGYYRGNSAGRAFEGDTNRPERYDDRSSDNRSRDSASTRSSGSDDNDYYLHRKPSLTAKNPGLADAIRDIESAFRSGNMSLLEKHVDRAGTLVLQVKGTTRQTMSTQDYLSMTQEALRVMKTARYELTKTEPASNGAVMVTGTHTLRTEDGQQKSFTVGFILKQRGDTWYVTEVSAEPAR